MTVLAAQEVDICAPMFDGDPADPTAPSKLQFEDGLAFQDYQLEMDPLVYEFSSIDGTEDRSTSSQSMISSPCLIFRPSGTLFLRC